MCTAAFDPTNPYSDLRMGIRATFGESNNGTLYTDPDDGKTYSGDEAVKRKYLDEKAKAENLEKEKEDRAKRAAYTTQFDAISADARGIRQRYAQSLGYNPYFLR